MAIDERKRTVLLENEVGQSGGGIGAFTVINQESQLQTKFKKATRSMTTSLIRRAICSILTTRRFLSSFPVSFFPLLSLFPSRKTELLN